MPGMKLRPHGRATYRLDRGCDFFRREANVSEGWQRFQSRPNVSKLVAGRIRIEHSDEVQRRRVQNDAAPQALIPKFLQRVTKPLRIFQFRSRDAPRAQEAFIVSSMAWL
jgi:hypothetical protein